MKVFHFPLNKPDTINVKAKPVKKNSVDFVMATISEVTVV